MSKLSSSEPENQEKHSDVFLTEILQLMPSTTHLSLTESKFPPTVMFNTLVVTGIYEALLKFKRFKDKPPSGAFEDCQWILMELTVYSCFVFPKTKSRWIAS